MGVWSLRTGWEFGVCEQDGSLAENNGVYTLLSFKCRFHFLAQVLRAAMSRKSTDRNIEDEAAEQGRSLIMVINRKGPGILP